MPPPRKSSAQLWSAKQPFTYAPAGSLPGLRLLHDHNQAWRSHSPPAGIRRQPSSSSQQLRCQRRSRHWLRAAPGPLLRAREAMYPRIVSCDANYNTLYGS